MKAAGPRRRVRVSGPCYRWGWSLVGGAAFWIGGFRVAGPDRQRTWQVYLINFLFWSGIAFSATVFVAILNITNARWGRPLKRLAEALGAFTPVAFLLFWVLYPRAGINFFPGFMNRCPKKRLG